MSLAYASLAGLPAHTGIYCYLAGCLGYALLGSSRQLAVGPTSAIAIVVGSTVATMSEGDPARWAGIAALTALGVAVISHADAMTFGVVADFDAVPDVEEVVSGIREEHAELLRLASRRVPPDPGPGRLTAVSSSETHR